MWSQAVHALPALNSQPKPALHIYILAQMKSGSQVGPAGEVGKGRKSDTRLRPSYLRLTLTRTNGTHLFVLLVTASLFITIQALPTTQEKAAIEQIFRNYPDLASIPSWESSPNTNTYYGRSWSNDSSTLCQAGDGYDFYGVYCKDGHIFGLRVYVSQTMIGENDAQLDEVTNMLGYIYCSTSKNAIFRETDIFRFFSRLRFDLPPKLVRNVLILIQTTFFIIFITVLTPEIDEISCDQFFAAHEVHPPIQIIATV